MNASEPAPARVAYVLPYIVRGGTEKQVLALSARIDRRRFSPVVIGIAGGGPLEEEFVRAGVPVHVLGFDALSPTRGGLLRALSGAAACIRRMVSLLRGEQVRIVHSYLPAANFVATVAGSIAGIPARLVSKRTLSADRGPLFARAGSAANLCARAILVNSSAVEADVMKHERFWGGKIHLIYNGVDITIDDPLPIGLLIPELGEREPFPVIACVGNFYPYKGHADLVRAARIITSAFPSARFLLAGRDAGHMLKVRKEIAALGLESHFFLPGSIPNAVQVMAASTLVVHPSHEEGFSNTILEAMAVGKAVVATAVGGNPEAVRDGVTGLLVPPRNPERLAGAILDLLADDVKRKRMGEAGRRRAEGEFSFDRMVREMEALYETMLEGKN